MSETAATEEFVSASNLSPPTATERVRERPLFFLGIAGLAGFVVGGGIRSRTGAAILMLIGRIWIRRTATDALANALNSYGTAKRNNSH
jgi:hypothetical protein